MNNTLIDNSSDQLSMVKALKDGFTNPNYTEVRIATGYWDIPGLCLVADELDQFLQKENSKLQLLIGKDPYVNL